MDQEASKRKIQRIIFGEYLTCLIYKKVISLTRTNLSNYLLLELLIKHQEKTKMLSEIYLKFSDLDFFSETNGFFFRLMSRFTENIDDLKIPDSLNLLKTLEQFLLDEYDELIIGNKDSDLFSNQYLFDAKHTQETNLHSLSQITIDI